MSLRKFRRCKLLLDEMFPKRTKFPSVNRSHDIKHIIHDFAAKKAPTSDDQVLGLAKREKRIIVTKNVKHFREKAKIYEVDLIGVSEAVEYGDLDRQLMAKLRQFPAEMSGKIFRITKVPRKR